MAHHQLELPGLVGWVQKLRDVEEITQTLPLCSSSSPWEVAVAGVTPC